MDRLDPQHDVVDTIKVQFLPSFFRREDPDTKGTFAPVVIFLSWAIAVCVAALAAPCGAAEDQTIIPPPGDYKMVEVVLEQGHPQKGDLTLRGGIRDGKLVIPNSLSVRIKAGELVFTADAVKGEFGWRDPARTQNQGPADVVIHQYTVDATIAGGAITGTWKSPDGKRTGGVTGWIKTEQELQAANAFTTGKDWPLYHGPLSSFAAAPCGLTLASDPKDFRLVWKSEDLMPCGQGNGCHYLPGMLMCRTIGGGASPVVSADGKVFAMGSLGRIYALDAQTGKPLWEVPNITNITLETPEGFNRYHGNAPVYVDGVVVMGNQADTLHGFDANTGKELWKLPGKSSSLVVPSRWTHQGKDSVISMDGARGVSMKIFCIEPKSGKVVWETDYKGGSKGVAVSGDILAGLTFSVKGEPDRAPECVAWRMTPEKAERIWATPVQAHPELSAPAVNDKYVVVGNHAPNEKTGEMQMLDLNTGKVVATVQGPAPINEGHIFMAENLVFCAPDGSHSHNTLAVYGATPETFKFQGNWAPPHHNTNSYHCKCLIFPVVEGRMFMRGFDGIHCYDLRKRP